VFFSKRILRNTLIYSDLTAEIIFYINPLKIGRSGKLLLALDSIVILVSDPRGTNDHILCVTIIRVVQFLS
jgi:hypothetical protein